METAYLLFKHHPNFKNIKFIVFPDLRGRLINVSDIPFPINKTISEFSKLFPNLCLDHMLAGKDGKFSDLWFLDNMPED